MKIYDRKLRWLKQKIEIALEELKTGNPEMKTYKMIIRRDPESINWNPITRLLNLMGLYNTWETPLICYRPTGSEKINPLKGTRWAPMFVNQTPEINSLEVVLQAMKTRFQTKLDLVRHTQKERVREINDIIAYLDYIDSIDDTDIEK